MMVGGPDRIRTGDLTLRKRSHYPSYATSPQDWKKLSLNLDSDFYFKCLRIVELITVEKLTEEEVFFISSACLARSFLSTSSSSITVILFGIVNVT